MFAIASLLVVVLLSLLITRIARAALTATGMSARATTVAAARATGSKRTLKELGLRDEGIAVLGVQRVDGTYRGDPSGPTWVHVGDTLIVYGRQQRLCDLDERRAGAEGDAAHATAVAEAVAAAREDELEDADRELTRAR
ncbi:MAG TPA: hypothetical protein VJ814_11130 [Gaiellaceae bacterium]|nr:hypothetical protein [Gaiellaceae bacterium]